MSEPHGATSTSAPETHAELIHRLVANVEQVIRGKTEVVQLAVTALLARGHILLEDVPGVGKTTLAASLARSLGGSFRRIQFTSDLLPSDIIGVSIYDTSHQRFDFKPGPVFANVILADEINRTPPRTQSALLEAMNAGQVSVDGTTYPLEKPFLVMATQNPLEFHGTYPLPESQLDRFLMRIGIGYPDAPAELSIMRRPGGHEPWAALKPIVSLEDVLGLQQACDLVRVEDSVLDYALAIVEETRISSFLALGVSPRGAQALVRSARARAVLHGRPFCLPDDVKALALPVLCHRLMLAGRRDEPIVGRDDAERVMRNILEKIPVPT